MATHPYGPNIAEECSDSSMGISHLMPVFLKYFRAVECFG